MSEPRTAVPAPSADPVYEVTLSAYEVTNLLQGLVFLKDVGGDTGDWHAQVVSKLLALNTRDAPNKTAQDQRRDLALRVGWSQLFPARGALS